MSELLSVEDAWARIATHIDWADRFWVVFVFTDDPRVIGALGQRAQAHLEAAGRELVLLRPKQSEDVDEVLEALVGGRRAGVGWVDLVRHDSTSGGGSWRGAWERLMLRLNERRELLRRRWAKGGIVFATTLDRLDETPALAPDLWTIRAMGLRVASRQAKVTGRTVGPAGQVIARRSPEVRSPALARQAVERARKRGDELGLLAALVALAQAEEGEESLVVAHEARALAERLLQERRDEEGRSRIAGSLEDLARALVLAGRPPGPEEVRRAEEALELLEKAVEIRRSLAEVSPDAYVPDLARVLNNLGVRLSSLGRREEAMDATQEAVEHYRKLAEASPDAHMPQLALALNNFGVDLSSLGQREEAMEATREAVKSYRKLAEASPEMHLPSLARALNNLGNNLSSLGRREEAIEAAQEAVEHYRKVAEVNEGAYLPDLAMALNNLGNRLSSLGRLEEAMETTQEAVEHCRKLAEASPDTYMPELAMALNNYGVDLSSLGRREEAMEATLEAIDIRRKLAEASPDTYLSDLTRSLGALGAIHADVGRYLLARDCYADALRIILPSFAKLPAAHAHLTMALAQDLQGLHEEHGVSIPEDLADVVEQLIDSDEPS